MLLQIDEIIGSLKVDVLFDKPLNLFTGFSGQGKTYLFSMLFTQCHINGIPCAYFDYKFAATNKDIIVDMCNNASVILFDNADLYLTDALFEDTINKDKIMIISMKKPSNIMRKYVHACKIRYTDTLLWVR